MSERPLNREVALVCLRQCLDGGGIIPTRHFRQELEAEQMTMGDAVSVLGSGAIYDEPEINPKTRQWKYRIEGYEKTGQTWLAIVFTFTQQSDALLITIFSIEERSKK